MLAVLSNPLADLTTIGLWELFRPNCRLVLISI